MRNKLRLPPLAPSKDPSDYPVFSGGVSRWIWRIYVQRFTPAGRWFAIASTVFVFYGGASLQLQGYMLAVYVGSFWFIAAIAMLLYRPRVELTAHHATRVCAGENIQVDVEIVQRGRLRGADLAVLPHRLPPDVDAVPDEGVLLPDLKRGERATTRLSLRCGRRGNYTLRGYRVETAFPFGIIRARRTFWRQCQIIVYPKFIPLARLNLPTGRRYQPGGVALVSQLGESFEYLGNREYRDGDNLRDIDWRATARSSRLIVREWVEEYMLRAAVILDTHVPAKLPLRVARDRRDSFERAVSVAGSVSDFMARQDYLVDIFAAGPNLYHLTAGRSLAYLDQILDILACVDENPHEPFDVIEPQLGELMSRLSTVICVFLDWNETRRRFVRHLHGQGVMVKVIICRAGPCTINPSTDTDLLGEVPIISKSDYDKGISEL